MREGDRGVEPADQLLLPAGTPARVAEGIERRAERLRVGLEHGVHQPKGNGVEAAGLRFEPCDPADEERSRGDSWSTVLAATTTW